MSILQAIVQGALQGLTEFLPVSSSGHLSVVQHFMGIESGGLLFSVLLHFGTLAAVVIAFFPTVRDLFVEFFRMIRDIFTGKFSYKNSGETRKMLIMLIVALIPLLAAYPLRGICAAVSEDADIIIEGICFLYTACLLLMADWSARHTRVPSPMGPGKSLFVGAMQAVAMLPGVSRSGSTIGAGLIAGVSREYMVKFSFILSIPVILAAGVSEIGDAIGEEVSIGILPLVAGILTAAVVGWLAIKLLSWMIKNDKLWIFSIYLFLLGGFTIAAGACGL